MPGKTTPGQNTSEIVYPNTSTRHAGASRSAPSSHPMYQSGCEAVLTAAGSNGPYSQMGLTWNRPPSRAMIENVPASSPIERAV